MQTETQGQITTHQSAPSEALVQRGQNSEARDAQWQESYSIARQIAVKLHNLSRKTEIPIDSLLVISIKILGNSIHDTI